MLMKTQINSEALDPQLSLQHVTVCWVFCYRPACCYRELASFLGSFVAEHLLNSQMH